MKKFAVVMLVGLIVVAALGSISAQEVSSGQDVQIAMSDGVDISGTFYAATGDAQMPAVLLLHHLGGSRAEWADLVTALLEKNYNVLAIDERGAGATGGSADWALAESDGVALMGWLREQSTVDTSKVTVVGASIGGNMALRTCAADPDCQTAIALSPGLDFMGVTTDDAVTSMKDKSIFVAATQHDPYGAQDTVKKLTADAPADVTIMTKIYGSGTEHGTNMFVYPDLIPTIVSWLDTYLAAETA